MIELPAIQTRLNEEEEQAVLRVLREGKTLAAGPEGAAFEQEFAAFIGSEDAVSLSNATAALESAAILSGLGPGDEVIIPAHTFVSSAVPFARTGATLKWADIDPKTRLVSAETIAPLITTRTRVLVVVHLYGLTADMDPIMALAEKHNLVVVEDCAQAPGARYKGKRVGTFGNYGCFSFHSQKNITTLGEGGMVAVKSREVARRVRQLRWMGNWPFEQERESYWKPAMGNIVEPAPGLWPHNFCLGEPNCAVGRLLIKRLDHINANRQLQAKRFKDALRSVPELTFQEVPEGGEHVYHLMSARFDGSAFNKHRDDLIRQLLHEHQLKCIVQYWPLYRSELFQKQGLGVANVPETDCYFDNMISFPWWSDMGDDLIDDMAQRVCRAVEALRRS
jgi:dTDP-4-amino-4,6-dideoxygalactose transaminase